MRSRVRRHKSSHFDSAPCTADFESSMYFVVEDFAPRQGCQQLAGWLSEAIPPVLSRNGNCTLEGCKRRSLLKSVRRRDRRSNKKFIGNAAATPPGSKSNYE